MVVLMNMKKEYAVVETLLLVLVIVNVKKVILGTGYTMFMVNVVVLKLILTILVFVVVILKCRAVLLMMKI